MNVCPKCGFSNPASEVNCQQCHMNLAYARDHIAELRAQGSLPDPEEELRRAELQKAAAAILLTTTALLQDRTVEAYLGIVSSVCVVGAGLLTEMAQDLADVFGTQAGAVQSKLQTIREQVLLDLKMQAAERGANAVIAVDIDYMTPRPNILMVSVNGTAVRLA